MLHCGKVAAWQIVEGGSEISQNSATYVQIEMAAGISSLLVDMLHLR